MKLRLSSVVWSGVLLVCAMIINLPAGYAVKYYSYQSGNWNAANIWTTDSTGTTLINSATPASNDIICVLTGRTITVTANITTTGHTITVNIGATLDLTDRTVTAIVLNGNGKVRTKRVSSGVALLPTISGGTFMGISGGTVEYYATTGSFYIDDNVASYCNLLINLGSTSQVITIRRNLTINGSLTIMKGTMRINDATTVKRNIAIVRNLVVESSGSITTGTGNTNVSPTYSIASVNLPPAGSFHAIFHQLTIGGDFTNNGTVRFTNLTAPNYGEFANNGAVTVRFTGEANSAVTLNGLTDFYNLIVDKGSDQTYILTLFSSAVGNFSLYGSNAVKRYQTTPFTQDNPEVRKALWIKNGTLKLTGSILIPSLAEGPVGPSDQNGDYAIGLSAQLWIDGEDVAVYTTATNNSGFPEAPAGSSGVSGPNYAEQALSIFGTFRITEGYFSTRHSAGIIFWNTANSSSMVIVEGGIINATVMRSTWTASGKTSYVQTGGTVYVRGDETEVGEVTSAVSIFSIPHPSSTFIMTGGEIIIRDCTNGTPANGNGLFLNCDPGNFSVTGGRIVFETNPQNTPFVEINSRVNLWNLEIRKLATTSGTSEVRMLNNLTVDNNLTVFQAATLSAGTGNYNVTVNSDFIINQGGTYTPGNNTTTFTGNGNHFLWNDGTITNGLYNLQVNRPLGSLILASSGNTFILRNDLSITAGILADGGKDVYVAGNVVNNGTHIGAGKISLNKTNGTQIISGNGLGMFQNLEINNSNGATGSAQVSLAADIGLTGVLTLANNRLFNISQYLLALTSTASIDGVMSNSRFIQTSGAPSDGGLRRQYADTTTYLFPVGTGSLYTPVTIHLKKKPSSFGTVSVKPTPSMHPFVSNVNCLPYYWKVEETGFSTIQANSIDLEFNYGNLAGNGLYVPGKYVPAFWAYLNDVNLVNEAISTISFPVESTFSGDYTAGIPEAFDSVTAYYSRSNGEWSTPATWSNQGYGGVAATTVPGPDNPVFIGDGGTFNHTVTVSSGSVFSGSLSIKQGSVLDIKTTVGHNFGMVIPGSYGKLRISTTTGTAVFPAGDFGNFLGAAGGTVEYYSGSIDFLIPSVSSAPTLRSITTYCHLQLTPTAARTITMPNTNLTINGNMIVSGTVSTALAMMNGTAAHSLTVKTDLLVNGGNLIIPSGFVQTIRVERHCSIAVGAIFNVATSGTVVAHKLSIGGNLVNGGTFDLSSPVTANPYRCDVTFTGSQAASISGRGATTDFYSLTIDKGSSINSVLNVSSTAFTFSNIASNPLPLTLVNGTFRLSTSTLTVTVATQKFTIPPNTCLSASGGTIQVATAANDDVDVILAGMIEVKSGAIYVGSATDSINNDIEYSGAGYPAIEVSGGTLFVNGQVRRSMINGLGSLVYKQSGSATVTINGRKSQPTRAKLEVLNPGSVFNMSGGTLNIVRGGSTTYNDLYLRPESSTITGGTIVFGSSATEGTGNMNNLTIDSQVPIFNLTVDGTTRSKTLTLSVHGITLKGSLTVQATSVFNADSLDVKIAGNLTNLNADAGTGVSTGGYRTGSYRQVTTFNGVSSAQSVTGTAGNRTNFARLVIANTHPSGVVTLQPNTTVRVNNDLTLSSGTMNDGGNVATVIGNITNNATHTGAGYILLGGSSVQSLSGNGLGKFGNIYLNSSKDVSMISTMEITGVLTFQGHMLDIGNNLLILSNTTAGSVVGNSVTAFIRTNGLTSDAGVRKSFPAAAHDFTFAVGCPQKYTPVRINVTANSTAGTITMIPVNSKHFCTTDPGNYQLNYYWHVLSTGFSALNASHTFTYLASDVSGTESSYIGGRFNNNSWTQGPAVNSTMHQFSFPDVAYIDGDYTAGYPSEFQNILTYYSRNATLGGPWNDVNTWSTVSHDGGPATSVPDGQIVFIGSGHTVTSGTNGHRAYTLTLTGTGKLDLDNTVGHDLGTVTGTGTIRLAPSIYSYYVFPAGNFISFTATGGGAIELSNSSGEAYFPYPQTYNRLELTGAGTKIMTDVDILLNGSLTNGISSVFKASAVGKLILNSDWINDGSFSHNNGTTVFNGTTLISGTVLLVLNKVQINQNCSMTGPLSSSLGIAGDLVNDGTFNHNSGSVIFSGNSTLSGNSTTTFNHLQIAAGATFTGKSAADFLILGNWVNNGSFYHNAGGVIINGNTTVSGSKKTSFGNLTISPSCQLTAPASDTLGVALNFTNNGTFVHNHGTMLFDGTVQMIAGDSPTLFENVVVASGSSTSVTALNQKLRGVLLCNGNLSANKNLTLVSDADQTALVDGNGNGEVIGNLVMQRYLPFGFGYKYLSSPFQGAKVEQFTGHVDLTAPFPTLYYYDESRFFTGWLKYINTSGVLNPMSGYAVNFGPSSDPDTLDLYGVVNNRNMIPLTLFNSNKPFTLGFNLIGNPYPSPIDWDAPAGWVRENIDDALYFFDAGNTDQYTGTYCTYINGVSSNGIASAIIPAMQAFFIHVSDGVYPVSSTLIFTNGVRVNNLSPVFHKKKSDREFPLLRLAASGSGSGAGTDPAVIYFSEESGNGFDPHFDALKLMNTDVLTPNLYLVGDDSNRLSISSIPFPDDSLTIVRVGIKTLQEGYMTFRVQDLKLMPPDLYIYFCDAGTGIKQNILLHPDYRIYLKPGTYEKRFSIVFSKKDLRKQPVGSEPFIVYSFRNRLFIHSKIGIGQLAELTVFNILGQQLLTRKIEMTGYTETDLSYPTGVYIVSLRMGEAIMNKKVFIDNQW